MNKKIALVITDRETNAQIKNLGVGLLELRADLFKKLDPAYIAEQIKKRRTLKIPLLLTVRNQKQEGALKTFSDKQKRQIIAAGLPLVDMVDIELSSALLKDVVKEARKRKVRVIVSSHYLKGMPKDLEVILRKSLKAGADIIKIAGYARSSNDVMTMLEFTQSHRKHGLITMCLGPMGSISRLIFPAAGSLYTYTFLNKPKAAGQVGIKTLKAHLKLYYPFSC